MVFRYILSEMIPSFLLGVLVFIAILLMFQALRLTELFIVHGVGLSTILSMMSYMSISFLPVIFPMSLLFTVLLTYGRLSGDSEVTALHSLGVSFFSISIPAIFLSLLVAFLSAQSSFHLGPWGNRQFELLISKIGSNKASVAIREGTFSEGFFDLVIYANRVDSDAGILDEVFIYDERNPDTPITIVAKQGRIIQEDAQNAQAAYLQLMDGDIHRVAQGRHTQIHFSTYDIYLSDPIEENIRKKSPQSLTLEEIRILRADPELKPVERRKLDSEYHRRWALSFACIIFALVGVTLGTQTNRRSGKSSGLVLSLVVLITYWALYAASEGISKNGQVPIPLAMWMPNIVFILYVSAKIYQLKHRWQKSS